LLDNISQCVISKFGLNTNEIVKDISSCGHGFKTPSAFFEVEDAKNDSRFLDNPLVTEKLNVSFLAAVPLVDSSNLIIGSVCVVDYNPKTLTVNQKKAFISLGAEVMRRIEVKLKNELLTSEIEIEKELEVSKSKLFNLYDEVPVVVFSTDPFFKRVTKCNGVASELLGFVKNEMIGKTLLDLFPTSGGEKIEQILKKIIEKGKIENQRLLVKTTRGKDINVAINSKAVINEKGEIIHCIYVFNLKKMVNEYVNRKVGAVLGYSYKEIQDFGSRLLPTLCHPEDLEHVLAHFTVVANLEDDKVASLEYRMKHKDLEYQWLLSEETVFERNDDGSLEKQLGVATDITTLKNIQASLSTKTEKLKVQNADLKQLAYVATHDLKHPIVVLQSHFHYLKKQFVQPSEDIEDSIEFIEDEIKNFNVTLKGLNDAIKVRELRIEKVPLNLTELIKATLPTFKRQVEQLGGKLTTRLLENVVVFGTTVYFQSIIQNLLSNAIEYRSLTEKLEINISTSVDKKGLIFNVEDNGLGMDLVR
jgi:PAS domain S-box-containing protein